ncbi:hypothetical protein [Dyella sp. 2RAB6]|uniref:hypothetical protein n=1 Tax=Dyella sp. 2RAB6 TaxID=3232992 RepID=UPI003F90BF91
MTLNREQIDSIELFAERLAYRTALIGLIASLEGSTWEQFQKVIADLRADEGERMAKYFPDLELGARCEAAFDATMAALLGARPT